MNPESGNKIFASAKVNITKEVSALSFRIDDAEIEIQVKKTTRGRVHWLGESNATARSSRVARTAKAPFRPRSSRNVPEAAETFLTDLIEKGPTPQNEIKDKAEGIHSWTTIKRAKRLLGIVSKKEPGVTHGDWIWDFAMPTGESVSEEL